MSERIEFETETINEWEQPIYLKGIFELDTEWAYDDGRPHDYQRLTRHLARYEARWVPSHSMSTETYPVIPNSMEDKDFRADLVRAFDKEYFGLMGRIA